MTNPPVEQIDCYIIEMEEIERSLRMLAELCFEANSTEFLDPMILMYIGDFLRSYLDKTKSARYYFLRRGKDKTDNFNYGFLGELKKLQEKHRSTSGPNRE